jgi:hypothetical protein
VFRAAASCEVQITALCDQLIDLLLLLFSASIFAWLCRQDSVGFVIRRGFCSTYERFPAETLCLVLANPILGRVSHSLIFVL